MDYHHQSLLLKLKKLLEECLKQYKYLLKNIALLKEKISYPIIMLCINSLNC